MLELINNFILMLSTFIFGNLEYIKTFVSKNVGYIRQKVLHNDYNTNVVYSGNIIWNIENLKKKDKQSSSNIVVRFSKFGTVYGLGIKVDDEYDILSISDFTNNNNLKFNQVTYSSIFLIYSYLYLSIFPFTQFLSSFRNLSVYNNALKLPDKLVDKFKNNFDVISIYPSITEFEYNLYGFDMNTDTLYLLGYIKLDKDTADTSKTTNESLYFQHLLLTPNDDYFYRIKHIYIGSGYLANKIQDSDISTNNASDVYDGTEYKQMSLRKKNIISFVFLKSYLLGNIINKIHFFIKSLGVIYTIQKELRAKPK